MNKKIICLLLFVFLLLVRAQEISIGGSWANEPAKLGKNKTLDTSVMECIYNYRIIDHSIGDMREYYAILEIGDTVSKFESYGSYRLDSVLVGKQQMTNGEFLKTYNITLSKQRIAILD